MAKTKKGKVCPRCRGTGDESERLPGYIRTAHRHLGIPVISQKKCSLCGGTGFRKSD